MIYWGSSEAYTYRLWYKILMSSRHMTLFSSFVFYNTVNLCLTATFFFFMLSRYPLPLFLYATRLLLMERRWRSGKKLLVIFWIKMKLSYFANSIMIGSLVQTLRFKAMFMSSCRCLIPGTMGVLKCFCVS